MQSNAPPLAPQLQSATRMRSTRTIVALILREVSMTNARALLGYVWEIVDPAVSILLITFILGLIFRSPPLGDNFPLFYASGILPYAMFIETSNKVATAVRFSRPLLAYPGVTFLHALIARFTVAAMTKLLVYVIVVTAIVQIYDLYAHFDYVDILMGLAMALGLGLALGALNCLLFAFVPMYEIVWSLVTRPLFLFSAIVYLFETVPLPYRDWLWWNPIIHMVGMMRRGLYPSHAADYVSVQYIGILIAIALPVAFFFLRRYWRELIEMQ